MFIPTVPVFPCYSSINHQSMKYAANQNLVVSAMWILYSLSALSDTFVCIILYSWTGLLFSSQVKRRNSEESSTQWTTGIAEIQLPIEYAHLFLWCKTWVLLILFLDADQMSINPYLFRKRFGWRNVFPFKLEFALYSQADSEDLLAYCFKQWKTSHILFYLFVNIRAWNGSILACRFVQFPVDMKPIMDISSWAL